MSVCKYCDQPIWLLCDVIGSAWVHKGTGHTICHPITHATPKDA